MRVVKTAAERRRRGWISTIFLTLVTLLAGFYIVCLAGLVALRWFNPPTTMVQAQRRAEAWLHHRPYQKHYVFVRLNRISPDLQHAIVAAEDGRFYQHHGVDWTEVEKVVDQDLDEGTAGARRVHDHPATRKESVPHHQPLADSQGGGVHPGARSRTPPIQAANPRTLSERDRVGAGNLRGGSRFARLVWRTGIAPQPRTGVTPGGAGSIAAPAEARAYELVQCGNPAAHVTNGMVTGSAGCRSNGG